MKKVLGLSTLALAGVLAFTGCSCGKDDLAELPAARLEKTTTGLACSGISYDLTCSGINESSLINYMDRSDVVYVDLRNYYQYQQIHLDGFVNVPFFSDIYDDNNSESATQLFKTDLTPRYAGSVEILETLFPKDKTIFLMCESGGRVKTMMKILALNGWNMNKVYNVGGMGNITKDTELSKTYENRIVSYSKDILSFKSATVEDTWSGHTYKTTAYVAVDKDGKITYAYITGDKEYTAGAAEGWEPENWISNRNSFVSKVVGKTKAEVQAMIGENTPATGADVVSGASISSNRVYKAIVAALNVLILNINYDI